MSAVLLGVVAFVAAAPLNGRVFALAGSAPPLAFNVGNTPGRCSVACASRPGAGTPPRRGSGWGLAAGAAGLGAVYWWLDRRSPL